MTVGDVLAAKWDSAPIILVSRKDTVHKAVELMRQNGISQLPVVGGDGDVIGSIQEITALQLVFDQIDIGTKLVGDAMGSPFPKLEKNVEVEKGIKALSLGASAVIVCDDGKPIGLLTKTDFITYLSGGPEGIAAMRG